jgi:hypothetical protein
MWADVRIEFLEEEDPWNFGTNFAMACSGP